MILPLHDYMCTKVGLDSVGEFRQVLDQYGMVQESEDRGISRFCQVLKQLPSERRTVSDRDLARYDINITTHLEQINQHRVQPIELKYFQYLSVLFTEIYLDRFSHSRSNLLDEINDFVEQLNERRRQEDLSPILKFTEEDLSKLAFWMATGSGKTFVMHFNYLQFLHYHTETMDTIILITPNEGLSNQHHRKFLENGIRSRVFTNKDTLLHDRGSADILIVDIHKLREETGDKTISVEVFEGKNLVFVDEGDMGMGGTSWMNLRQRLAEHGFVFEYSATFGQSLDKNRLYQEEYAKSILVDYSYPQFYQDGYGKDFEMFNLTTGDDENDIHTVMVANLLSFYEKILYFTDHPEVMANHHIKRPLWIFVGHSVTSARGDMDDHSDITTVLKHISQIAERKHRTIATIAELLDPSGGTTPRELDRLFTYLREQEVDAETIYQNILRHVFHTGGGSPLRICRISRSEGEIGLSFIDSTTYFGVINIGDTRAFLNLAEEVLETSRIEEDYFASPLFDSIQSNRTPVNLLIGARKFIQGWDTWRVTNMGLLNVARSAGPQIIQLFGRGVRLLGRDRSLQRSTHTQRNPPDHIEVIETLSIFGIRATYLEHFKDILVKEKISEELKNKQQNRSLLTRPRNRTRSTDHTTTPVIQLAADREIQPVVRISTQITHIHGTDGNATTGEMDLPSRIISTSVINLLDFDQIYFDILDYTKLCHLDKLVIKKNTLQEVVAEENAMYQLYCPRDWINPQSPEEIRLTRFVVTEVLKAYIDRYVDQVVQSSQ